MTPDYTLVFGEPPVPKPKGPPAGRAAPPPTKQLAENLEAVARAGHKTPGCSARIVSYDNHVTARTQATELRKGRKLPNRPAGIWEFKTGPTEDGRFGIWARYWPQ